MRLFAALSHRPFALLWAGRTISSVGDGIYLVALAWFVISTTGSAAANGVILICTVAPQLLLSLAGGVLVDRLPRRGLLLLSDGVRGLVVGVVAALAATHHLVFWHLAVLSAIFGAVDALFYPAYTSIIPQVTPSEALTSANSLISLSRQAIGIIGPALGGALVALGGTSQAFALDALSFFISCGCILAMPTIPAASSKEEPESRSMLADLREGLGTVLGSPWLWITIAVAGISNVTLSGPLEAALPLLVRQGLRAGVGAYSALNAVEALGAVIAAVWLAQHVKLRRRGLLMYGGWLLGALAVLIMGLPVTVVGAGLAIFAGGAGISTLNLVWSNTLQELVPAERLGRVASIDALGSYALLPIGYGLGGLAADRIGASAVFVLGGATSLLLIALGLLHPAVRGLD